MKAVAAVDIIEDLVIAHPREKAKRRKRKKK
jgi:hypothetical protein